MEEIVEWGVEPDRMYDSIDRIRKVNAEDHHYYDILDELGCGMFQLSVFLPLALSAIAGSFIHVYLSILPNLLKCDSNWDKDLLPYLSYIGIIGILTGAVIFGLIADVYGRKISLVASNLSLTAFTIGCAFVVNGKGFVALIFLISMASAGCQLQPLVYVAEVTPMKSRCFGIFGIFASGILGKIMSLGMALPLFSHGWKFWVGFNAIVPLLALLFSFCLPESPLFNLSHKETAKKAIGTLHMYARFNNGMVPTGHLQSKEAVKRGNPKSAFDPLFKRTSLIILFVFFAQGFLKSGSEITKLSLQQNEGNCGSKTINSTSTNCTVYDSGILIGDIGYQSMNFISILIGLVSAEVLGRKWSIFGLFTLNGIIFLINIACINITAVKALTYTIKLCEQSILWLLLMYTLEIYNNEKRAIMTAINFSVYVATTIIGGIALKFVLKSSMENTLIFLGLFSMLGALVIAFLPHETKNKAIE